MNITEFPLFNIENKECNYPGMNVVDRWKLYVNHCKYLQVRNTKNLNIRNDTIDWCGVSLSIKEALFLHNITSVEAMDEEAFHNFNLIYRMVVRRPTDMEIAASIYQLLVIKGRTVKRLYMPEPGEILKSTARSINVRIWSKLNNRDLISKISKEALSNDDLDWIERLTISHDKSYTLTALLKQKTTVKSAIKSTDHVLAPAIRCILNFKPDEYKKNYSDIYNLFSTLSDRISTLEFDYFNSDETRFFFLVEFQKYLDIWTDAELAKIPAECKNWAEVSLKRFYPGIIEQSIIMKSMDIAINGAELYDSYCKNMCSTEDIKLPVII